MFGKINPYERETRGGGRGARFDASPYAPRVCLGNAFNIYDYGARRDNGSEVSRADSPIDGPDANPLNI